MTVPVWRSYTAAIDGVAADLRRALTRLQMNL
ncbi:hypothetical protein GGD83_004940 [Rhodoblastus sphagnicola]|nr:hypothetical protein [Rhodoblastus sphagnicola]